MPVAVERLPGKPIIILHYSGLLDVETVKSAFAQSLVLAQQIEGTIYRIADVSHADGTFQEVMGIIKAVRDGSPGSPLDARIQVIFVGTNQLVHLYTNAVKNMGATPMPVFHSLEDALHYVELEQQKQLNLQK